MYSNYKILNLNARSSTPQDKESFPTIKQPHRAGEYSLSPEGHYEDSPARLCFLTQLGPNTFPFSLNASGEAMSTEQSFLKPRYLDNMFCFLRCSMETLIKRHENGHLQVDADIVCSRETLQLIMCAPYEYKNNWTIAVSKYRNTIYICPVPNPERPQSFVDPEHLKKLMMDHWMTKLRQRCLVAMDDDIVQPGSYQQKKLDGQYYCVFSMNICGLNVLFDAPILAEHCPNPFIGLPKTFVDLRMRLDTMSRTEWSAHNRNVVLKWWVESFLVGIEKVYIAYHDKEGYVQKIKHTMVRELWRECDNDWSPNICGNFLRRLLGSIQLLLANVDSASTVYLLEYDSKNGSITYKYCKERNEHSFIPDWFRILMEEHMDHLNAQVQHQI
ncbi:protein cutoff [Drosophila virilis]|uniref:Decapping nuclease n=1 Tax=Drosophila virilis TaxID=7244 RepID=B4MDX9_DROVI|nr:protein cutoff [Drosophila virilis]EDW58744.1 uncharacterized protein Dvir_GJ17876 [Drosophila virilis]